mgnify:CR=1 FL=1
MLHLCQRIYNLLDDLKERNDGKTYLLVAHNGISRVIESYFHDMTNEEFAKFGIKNCELKNMSGRVNKHVNEFAKYGIRNHKLKTWERKSAKHEKCTCSSYVFYHIFR